MDREKEKFFANVSKWSIVDLIDESSEKWIYLRFDYISRMNVGMYFDYRSNRFDYMFMFVSEFHSPSEEHLANYIMPSCETWGEVLRFTRSIQCALDFNAIQKCGRTWEALNGVIDRMKRLHDAMNQEFLRRLQ